MLRGIHSGQLTHVECNSNPGALCAHLRDQPYLETKEKIDVTLMIDTGITTAARTIHPVRYRLWKIGASFRRRRVRRYRI